MGTAAQSVNKIAQNHIVTAYIRQNPDKYIRVIGGCIDSVRVEQQVESP